MEENIQVECGEIIIDARETPDRRYIRRKKARIIKEFGGQCQSCGAKQGDSIGEKQIVLEFAHKIGYRLGYGTSRGSKERILEVERNMDKFFLFCKACHLKYDRDNPLNEDEKIPF